MEVVDKEPISCVIDRKSNKEHRVGNRGGSCVGHGFPGPNPKHLGRMDLVVSDRRRTVVKLCNEEGVYSYWKGKNRMVQQN